MYQRSRRVCWSQCRRETGQEEEKEDRLKVYIGTYKEEGRDEMRKEEEGGMCTMYMLYLPRVTAYKEGGMEKEGGLCSH